MNVIFIEPSFPYNQREFVRALHAAGANVIGIGERPASSLSSNLKEWLAEYVQVSSVVHEPSLLEAVTAVQRAVWVDRLEATVEAHIMAAATVREAARIPGTSVKTAFLCRDKPAMKEALRDAGIPCAQSTRAKTPQDARDFASAVGYPLIIKPPAGAGASATYRVRDDQELERVIEESGLAEGRAVASRGIHRGARRLSGYIDNQRRGYPRIHHSLLPERIAGDARTLDIATNGYNQPDRRARIRRGAQDGARRCQDSEHRYIRNTYGVVRRAEGIEVFRNWLPPARSWPVGRLQCGQRIRPVF